MEKSSNHNFVWLNSAGEVPMGIRDKIFQSLIVKTKEQAKPGFESKIISNRVMPILYFGKAEEFIIVNEDLSGTNEIIREYKMGEIEIREKIFVEENNNISLRSERIDYSGQYRQIDLPKISSITQTFRVAFSSDIWCWGAHYSASYLLDEVAIESRIMINQNNKTMQEILKDR